MNKIKFLAVTFLLFSSVLFTSCDDEPIDPALNYEAVNNGGGNSGGEVTTYSIKVTQDGVSKQWNTTQAIYIKSFDAMTITGSNGSTSMTLFLASGIESKVYPFDSKDVAGGYTENANIYSSDFDDNSQGNITVTELNKTNKTIKGTFNFIGKNEDMTVSKVFTNGEFFVKYSEQ